MGDNIRLTEKRFCAASVTFFFSMMVLVTPARATDQADAACTGLHADNMTLSATMQSEARASASTGLAEGKDEPFRVCVIKGEIASSATSVIHFRLDLPEASVWNKRLLMVGGGGFDGFVPTDSRLLSNFDRILGADAGQIARFAIVSSDSGHRGLGTNPYVDFSWAAGNPTAVRNFAYEANHSVLTAAIDLSRQFYGTAPAYRYIAGTSNGGRAGLAAIQRYPDDYNGVLALAPAISQEGFAANMGPELLQWTFGKPDHWLDPAQVALYEKGELQACDALDGLKDGILGNPDACHYDGKDLLCPPASAGGDSCLTADQLETIRKIHSFKRVAVKLADGWVGYEGYGRGGESSDWVGFLFGPSFAARGAADYLLADGIVKWGITNDGNASVMTHDPTKWASQYRALSDEIDATNPDLNAFHGHGGKLIIWQGVSDACVSYKQTARYVGSVERKLGKPSVAKFVRFYISPAMGHSLSGAGAMSAPLLSELEQWVENGHQPESVTATLLAGSANPGATRPLCEYPFFPRYKGKGDASAAASFECAER